MSEWATTRLIAEREVSERVRGRVTRLMTVATAVLVVAGVTIPGLIKGGATTTRIGLVGGSAQAIAPALRRTGEAARLKVRLRPVHDDAAARAALLAGRLDVAVVLSGSSARLEVKEKIDSTVRAVLQAALDASHLRVALAQARLPVARVLPALTPVRATTVKLQPPAADRGARSVAAIAAGLLMYISLTLYGGAVATGVAQEKTSRTAEVLLATLRPRQLLSGKVIGIGVVGLGQLAIAAIAGLVANALVHSAKIPGSVWALLPTFLVFFLAGFLLYAFAFAAAGSLVARQEEVQFVTTPLALPLLIGYLLAYAAIASPNATWLKVISFLPPLTATVMPARIALGHIAWWELPLAALLMAGSIYAMVRLAARVYAGALIHGGDRLSWRSALRLAEGRSAGSAAVPAVAAPRADATATLELSRRGSLVDAVRGWPVVLDGERAGTIRNGERLTLALAPGPHTLSLGGRLLCSPVREFELGDGEQASFVCRARALPGPLALPYVVAALVRHDLWIRLSVRR